MFKSGFTLPVHPLMQYEAPAARLIERPGVVGDRVMQSTYTINYTCHPLRIWILLRGGERELDL